MRWVYNTLYKCFSRYMQLTWCRMSNSGNILSNPDEARGRYSVVLLCRAAMDPGGFIHCMASGVAEGEAAVHSCGFQILHTVVMHNCANDQLQHLLVPS
jgi:hypothetical protein